MKKAFHPCLWIAILSLVIMSGVFLVRNMKIGSDKPLSTLSTVESLYKININTADSDTLQQLPGIGPSTAEKILTYREANGPFTEPAQLLNIPGIGEKKLIALLEYVNWEE